MTKKDAVIPTAIANALVVLETRESTCIENLALTELASQHSLSDSYTLALLRLSSSAIKRINPGCMEITCLA